MTSRDAVYTLVLFRREREAARTALAFENRSTDECGITMQRNTRMKREIQLLTQSPPPGVSCWTKNEKLDFLEARRSLGEHFVKTSLKVKLNIETLLK